MESNNSIHVKINYNGSIRRFAFSGTEFTSLKETIARLFLITDEFVLKYLDDENEYVTLECQDDLRTAREITPKILRIAIEKRTGSLPSSPVFSNVDPVTGSGPEYKKHCKRRYHNEHRYHGQHHHHHKDNSQKGEWKKIRVEKKLAFINQCLRDLGYPNDDANLNSRDQFKKQRLLKKQAKLEAFINAGCQHPPKRILTEEEEQFNRSLKQQIFEIKVSARKVKERQRELKIVLQSRPGDQIILEELKTLKDKKAEFKTQKRALCDQMKS